MQNILKCFAGKFKRLKYFHGMLLTEQDFQEEQTYFRDKNKLHNRLHGYGVVWGLELKIKPGSSEEPKIIITPGFALDCDGNEIIVCKNHEVKLKDKIDELNYRGDLNSIDECYSPPGSTPKIYIGIQYCDCNADPVAQYTSECSSDDLTEQFSRTKEGYAVKLFRVDELPSCPELTATQLQNECLAVQPQQYCQEGNVCYAEKHYVILGSIEINDTIEDKNIDKFDCRKLAFTPSLWHYLQWEQIKQAFINDLCKDWVDISKIIGKKYDRAVCILQNMGITTDIIKIQKSDLDIYANIDKIRNILPYVPTSEKIALITDKDTDDATVLFAIIDPA